MALILRSLGIWLMVLALVLMVMDGTRSLGDNSLVLTSLSQLWSSLHAASLEQAHQFVADRFFAGVVQPGFAALLTAPAFIVVGVPALMLLILGRRPRSQRYVRQDQF